MALRFQSGVDYRNLIPELGEWNNGAGIAPDDWIGCVGDYKLAVGYSLIFWPTFIIIDDYVLRYGETKENLDEWIKVLDGNSVAVQSMINHMHISDMHPQQANEDQVRYLGRTLQSVYKAKLNMEFPDRTFIVRFNDEPGLDILNYELTFWQVRDTQAD